MKRRWFYIYLAVIFMIILSSFQLNEAAPASGYADPGQNAEINLVINEIMPDNLTLADEDGDFEDWIELFNAGGLAVNLKGYGLSDKHKTPMLWTFPDVVINPGEYLLVWASGKDRVSGPALHTNFKISEKEAVILSNPQNSVVSSILVSSIFPDISYGYAANVGTPGYLSTATPGTANSGETIDISPFFTNPEPPVFSHESGFYSDTFDLTLSSGDPDAVIRYTMDGSDPTADSPVYESPVKISSRVGDTDQYSAITGTSINDYPPEKEVFKATVIRARAFPDGDISSETVTHTYFVDRDMADRYNLQIVSLVTDPGNLFDYEKGIYVKGKIYDDWMRKYPNTVVQGDTPANYNQRGREWERPASIEFFEPDGTAGFSQDVGIRTSGAWSRANRHKSLRVIARSDYDGNDSIDYELFPGLTKRGSPSKPLVSFKEILLRSSGNDWEFTFFRDAFMQSLVSDLGIDTQAYRPAVMFINGEFWGIHNIRETFDQYYIQNNYNIGTDDVVILEGYSYANGMGVFYGRDGDEKSFLDMIEFVRSNDMTLTENYDIIKSQMDVKSFITYSIAEIYFANTDWPGNNVKVWRKRTDQYEPNAPVGQDGRWRWMLYDTDFGFQLYSGLSTVSHNSLEFATTPDGQPWPNPDWATVLLRTLLSNEEFKTQFLTEFSDLLNSRFQPDFMIKRITEMRDAIEPAMQEHLDRWMINGASMAQWKSQIGTLIGFAQNRNTYIMRDLRKFFDITQSSVTLEVSDPAGGAICINSIQPDLSKGTWSGSLFDGIPVTFAVSPNEGYSFVGWVGSIGSGKESSITLLPDEEDIVLKAVFEKK